LNFFVKPFLYSLDIIDIQYKNYIDDYINLTYLNDLKLSWSEYSHLPLKFKEYIKERVKEINEKRMKVLKNK